MEQKDGLLGPNKVRVIPDTVSLRFKIQPKETNHAINTRMPCRTSNDFSFRISSFSLILRIRSLTITCCLGRSWKYATVVMTCIKNGFCSASSHGSVPSGTTTKGIDGAMRRM
jgi:hypothetical protein